MLCITKPAGGTRSQRVTANILPCEISHTGVVSAPKQFWNPQLVANEHAHIPGSNDARQGGGSDSPLATQSRSPERVPTVYFRGRKLLGRTCTLPEGYRGIVVSGEKKLIASAEPELEPTSRPQNGTAFSRMLARREYDDDGDDDMDDDDIDFQGENANDDSDEKIALEGMQEVSTFRDVTVWEHDVVPGADEPFIRGVDEWLAFAQTIHST